MKQLLTLIIILVVCAGANAQTTSGTKQAGQRKPQLSKQEKKRIQRGTGQYHGSRDTTPGSPMGTGGAGGDMSGSPEASAIKTEEEMDDAQSGQDSTNNRENTTNTGDTTAKQLPH